jgi:hypothetical protein
MFLLITLFARARPRSAHVLAKTSFGATLNSIIGFVMEHCPVGVVTVGSAAEIRGRLMYNDSHLVNFVAATDGSMKVYALINPHILQLKQPRVAESIFAGHPRLADMNPCTEFVMMEAATDPVVDEACWTMNVSAARSFAICKYADVDDSNLQGVVMSPTDCTVVFSRSPGVEAWCRMHVDMSLMQFPEGQCALK